MLVAETANIELHFQAGPGAAADEIFVLFAPHQFGHDGVKFWGDSLPDKIGITCLAFVDKSSAWYPAQEMQELAGHARPYLDRYSRVISYGASMGGYAALKHGRLLGTTHAIAFSPQYSINPADVPGDTRYRQFFSPSLHRDMRVQPGDVAGHLIAIHDPWCTVDADHIALLKQAGIPLLDMPAYLTGHSTVICFARSERIRELFALTAANEFGALRRAVQRAAKASPAVRARAAIEHAVAAKAARAEALLNRFERELPADQRTRLRATVARRYVADKNFDAAARNAAMGILYAPADAALLELLSDILFDLKQDSAAHVWLQRAIQADGQRHSAHYRLARYRARRRDFNGAVAAALSAVEHSGAHPVMMHTLSEMYTSSGNTEMALRWAVAAADKAPQNPWLQVRAAKLLLQNGDHAEVDRYLRQADRSAATDPRVSQAVAEIGAQLAEAATAVTAAPLFERSIFATMR